MKTHALMILALSLAPSLLNGSGSYSIRPPRPPAPVEMARDTDRERYELGKKIYSGKARLTPQPTADVKQQEARLKALQARLPESAQKKTNLPALTGQLSSAELDALEYYVNKRFPVK
jgi:hypothetical protein